MPSSKLSTHEHRERWLTIIAGSLPPVVIWRVAKEEHFKVTLTIRRLDSHYMIIAAGLQNPSYDPALHTGFKQIHDLLASLENGYTSAMDWMEETQLIDGEDVTNFQNPERRTQREFVIKQMVIFHRRVEQIRDLLDHLVANTKVLQQTGTLPNLPNEESLRDLLTYIEQALDEARVEIRQNYNNGHIFADYVRSILENISAEKELYARWGRHYPYPVPKVIECEDKDSVYWREFGPVSGQVPRIEDDEDTEWLLF